MATPHDALFKQIHSVPSEAAAELRHVLPRELADLVDWTTLELESGSFVDDELREQHADLLFSAVLAGKRAFLYFLLEHKSGDDRWTALQVLVYVVRIWQRYRRECPGADTVPAILTVVVHHGAKPWSAPTDVFDLVDLIDRVGRIGLNPSLRAMIAPFLPKLRFFVDDLAQVSEDELRNRELSDTARVVLLCLQRARLSVDIFAELARWHDELQAIAGTPGGAGSLTAIVSYIMEVCGVPLARVGRFLRVHVDPEMKTEVMTMLDYMKEKFRAEGRAEGRADGRAELLLKQLAARFGAIPADVESRVRTASDALLDTWAERVLIAETLDQVLDD